MEMKGTQRFKPHSNASYKRDGGKRKYINPTKVFVEQFTNLAKYHEPRPYVPVARDMQQLWIANPLKCIQFTAYTRLITRKCRVVTPEGVIQLDTQRGEGLKHEGLMRMMWLAMYHKPNFHNNIAYFAAAGCWKDFITMLTLDVQWHGFKHRLDWDFFKKTIYAGLVNGQTCDLVKKYLPRVQSNVACKTDEAKARNIVAKFLAEGLYGKPKDEGDFSTYRKYRKMKNSGTANQWQQLISQKKFLEIDFDTVPGRALALLAGSKFLKHQGLKDRYRNWLKSRRKPVNSGFIHDLFRPLGLERICDTIPEYMETSIDMSFNAFVEHAKAKKAMPLLVVRDISRSTNAESNQSDCSPYSIGKAYALYHSELLPTIFKGSYGVLESKMELRKFIGQTPCIKWRNDTEEHLCQKPSIVSVADLLCDIKKNTGVDEGEFPKGCLIVSNNAFTNIRGKSEPFAEFKQRLLQAGFSKEFVRAFKIIVWQIPNPAGGKVIKARTEILPGVSNCYFVNGIGNATAAFITGEKRFQTPHTPKEVFENAMNQELLNMLVYEKEPTRMNASVQKKPVKVNTVDK
jgi:hypothetical protein